MTTDPARWAWATVAVLLWLGEIGIVMWRTRMARRSEARKAAALRGDGDTSSVLVAFSSQTGFGEELAWMTARALSDAGTGATVSSLSDLDVPRIKAHDRALFILSTTGEGDAPDSASRFVRHAMASPEDLAGLRYGVLALGDRSYRDFCSFGHAVDGWLRQSSAEALFDLVEVDDGDVAAVRHWQHHLNHLTGATTAADWVAPTYERWRLTHRERANPGSPGGEAWHLALEPVGHAPTWQAGDIAEVGIPAREGDAVPGHREYSVASLPGDGRAEFLVRLMQGPDGTPGRASGWLTRTAAIGDEVAMRIRTNRSFHGPAADVPLILIGNGTGIAGLRAHLKARATQDNRAGCWLMFGERTLAHDAFYDDELKAMLDGGILTRLDRSFSRDTGAVHYVQDLIVLHADDLRAWVDRDAAIYVCGSLMGMAKGVQTALEQVLGPERLVQLMESGRYRRDVY